MGISAGAGRKLCKAQQTIPTEEEEYESNLIKKIFRTAIRVTGSKPFMLIVNINDKCKSIVWFCLYGQEVVSS